jgi:hypothetical protein
VRKVAAQHLVVEPQLIFALCHDLIVVAQHDFILLEKPAVLKVVIFGWVVGGDFA